MTGNTRLHQRHRENDKNSMGEGVTLLVKGK